VSRFGENLDGARAWVESLPAGPVRAAAWRALGQSAMFDLPPGPDRDAMLGGRAFGTGARTSPISQLETIAKIEDPVLKRDLFDEAMESSAQFTASDWLQQSMDWMETADVPDEWKRDWREEYGKK
jgi:hypothetical protein